jgi:transcription factor CRZ1
MESDIARGRSPSQGHSNHISPQPSPRRYHDASSNLGLDPAVNHSTFSTAKFAQGGTSSSFQYPSSYLDSSAQSQNHPQATAAEGAIYQNNQYNQNAFQNSQDLDFQDNQTFDNPFLPNSDEFLFANENSNMQGDFSNTNFALDPAFDPNQQSNVNPANLSKMSSHMSTPPNLLSPENHSSPGQPGSPASTQGQFYTPQHSRHQSLDPASAAFPPGSTPNDWQGMSFQQHRRAASDQSDISSNAPSPFLPHAEIGESIENSHSPMMAPQHDGINAFGIENFSINDQQQAQVSPGHSPYISPRLLPQQNQGMGMAPDFMLQQGMQTHMPGPGPEIYTSQPDESFRSMSQMHARHTSVVSDMGRADQLPAPTINIEPAPGSRQASFEPESGNLGDNLSPPTRESTRSICPECY